MCCTIYFYIAKTMNDIHRTQAIRDHWERDDLSPAIRDALIASGKNLDALTLDDLAPFDQFHGGGKGFTVRLARLANLKPGMSVLDVGGGLGAHWRWSSAVRSRWLILPSLTSKPERC